MELMDMGRKIEPSVVAEEGKSKEPKITYPGFSLTGDKIPNELKDANLEDMCRLEIVVKKINDGIDTYADGKPRRVEVEIHKLGYIAKAGKKTFEEYDKSSKEEKEKYDKENAGIEGDTD